MLVLTRKKSESIIIGETGEVTVTVLAISGSQVSLGVKAQSVIPIYREEIYHRIKGNEGQKPAS